MPKPVSAARGSLVALPTPFRDNVLDRTALSRLVCRQIDAGTRGIVPCGSTGEAPALSADEYAETVTIVAAAAKGIVPIIAGCTASSTAATITLASIAARAGADALLCAPPPYVKPSQQGIIAHVSAIVDATGTPMVLYDVPSRCAVALADETIAQLHLSGYVIGLKDATADVTRPARLRALCGTELLQWSGDDATAVAHRAHGGIGCISVTANLVPALCVALHDAWDRGDTAEATALSEQLNPLHAALFAESNPIPLKAALAALNLCTAELRLPLTGALPETVRRLRRLLASPSMSERDSLLAQYEIGVQNISCPPNNTLHAGASSL